MALILGWDTETSGLETRTDFIFELGAAIYDTDTKQILRVMDDFILWPERPLVTPTIEKLTGISQKLLDQWGIPPEEAIANFFKLADKCEYVVGHNSLLFDRPMLETAILRCKDQGDYMKQNFYKLRHLDTTCDIDYPEEMTTRKLTYLCFENGIYIQHAHRALFDVFGCLDLVGLYPFSDIVRVAATPLLTIEAFVSYEEREMASSRGFYWQKKSKQWLKKIRKIHYEEKKFNFQTRIVEQVGGFDCPTPPSDPLGIPLHPETLSSRNSDSNKQLPLGASFSSLLS